MERIGIYGGTFNPPHLGHFRGAEYALEQLRLDRLLMIPTHTAPHKESTLETPTPQQRLRMVQLGLGDREDIIASDIEISRGGISYTFETVQQVAAMYPGAELFLVIGTDMFSSFESWREPERILKHATLAVLCRGEKGEQEQIAEAMPRLTAMGGKVELLQNPVTAISSTDLRRMLCFRCASDFLPQPVEEFILRNGLYGSCKNYRHLPIEQLQEVVVSLLKPDRVAHVLGCRETAVELARLYGADETDAARAALLHDITKALGGQLQLTMCRSYGTMLDKFSQKNPKTLHALTGSLVAERIFGENEAVVDAIRCHTTGKADMNLLEKILYAADYVEPNRDFPGVEELRNLAYTDITKALKLGLQNTLNLLHRQGSEVSPESMEALFFLEYTGI